MSFKSVDEQMALILRGVVDVHVEAELRKKLEKSYQTNTPLRIKAGFDPTAPDLHVGHSVVITKMRQFQLLGHHILFLIGDFTGRIGDPTGRNVTRKALTAADVAENAETYKAQVFKILDPELTEVVFNNTWISKLGADGMVNLASKYTVARMMEREDFKQRFKSGQSISVHEFLYPLVQAYDSVELKVDVELGGTDQLFNLLMGRTLMKEYGQAPQCVLTTPLLEGLDARLEDGKLVGRKMSKSYGNTIGFNDAPVDMFGKVMSISDDLMWRFYDLLSTEPTATLKARRADVARGALHPMEAKTMLGKELVTRYHNAELAEEAATSWKRVFSQRQIPEEMPELEVSLDAGPVGLVQALRDAGLVSSGGEAKRLVKQGGVSIDGVKVQDVTHRISSPGRFVIKAGKKRFLRLIAS